MKSPPVAFIAYNEYDNLGVGYMASVLSIGGFETRIIDSRKNKSSILKILKTINPVLVGFSVIFLDHIHKFIELVDYLRKGGINCHFTAGGHYASIKYEELFNQINGLDSIIRFEGEYPVLELAKCIQIGRDWRKIQGIVFKENGNIVTNPIWPVERDLDKFPFPLRNSLRKYAFNIKFTTILAGRGCVHNCSFCNNGAFFRLAGGPVKRIRKPEEVVREMEYLFYEKDCPVFLFQDDDFPVKSPMQPDWLLKFCAELGKTGLNKQVLWKINCRPDEVDEETFSMLKKNGLFLIFIGIEDGTDVGLKRLNKNMNVANIRDSLKILKKLEIGFDYGFMLFQPLTTYSSLNENLDFLKEVCGDGYTPVTFLRLVPLYETRVEKELSEAGRLIISNGISDYEFLEESMNHYYSFAMDCFNKWLYDPYGIQNISRWARNYVLVYLRFFDDHPAGMNFLQRFREIMAESNVFLLDTMKKLADFFESGQYRKHKNILDAYKRLIKAKHQLYKGMIILMMSELIKHFEENQIHVHQ